MNNNISDKDLFYSILSREISNITRQLPYIGAFSDILCKKVIYFIDPYVSAFLTDGTSNLDTDQLGEFIKEEVNDKIEKFKLKYNAEKRE